MLLKGWTLPATMMMIGLYGVLRGEDLCIVLLLGYLQSMMYLPLLKDMLVSD